VTGFGQRMALRRQSADYTQQQLADEVGESRRMIAYYEGETGHPPASFLVELARALDVSTDELLGLTVAKPTSNAISTRWERRIRQIERLGHKPRQQIVAFINAIVTAEQIKQKAGG